MRIDTAALFIKTWNFMERFHFNISIFMLRKFAFNLRHSTFFPFLVKSLGFSSVIAFIYIFLFLFTCCVCVPFQTIKAWYYYSLIFCPLFAILSTFADKKRKKNVNWCVHFSTHFVILTFNTEWNAFLRQYTSFGMIREWISLRCYLFTWVYNILQFMRYTIHSYTFVQNKSLPM